MLSVWYGNDFSFSCKSRKDKAQRINPPYRPFPLKLFLERINFPADNISSSVAWKFRGGVKVQKHVGSARVTMNAKQERIKRVYLLLMRNDNRFFRTFLYLSMYQSTLASRNRKSSEDLKDSLRKLSLKSSVDRLNTIRKLVSVKRDRFRNDSKQHRFSFFLARRFAVHGVFWFFT